jgi:hypothetical protein
VAHRIISTIWDIIVLILRKTLRNKIVRNAERAGSVRKKESKLIKKRKTSKKGKYWNEEKISKHDGLL